MPPIKPLIVGVAIGAIALMAALAFESVYRISIRDRQPEPLESVASAADITTPAATPTFALRLVDSGGVGIPLSGNWGTDYSHDRRAFREVILTDPPYVDSAAFDRVAGDWRSYVERMLEYGNNAVVVPLLLELMDFDRVSASSSSPDANPVYASDGDFPARHAAVRSHFGQLFDWTTQRGMQVFLDTDMLTLTQPLAQRLRAVAPAKSGVGIDTSDPAVWEVYRAGLEELFDELPSIQGLVIRFGEGGNLYNTEGWPYRSEMAVRSATSLRAMLHGLLPLFEARHKTLVLRSWTVGVGQIGRLHIDPRVYEAVLGEIDSPAFVVSTKFTAGDFFSYLPLNPTLASGRHRRVVELQAKPEFEGFGAFPNFLGEEHARALRALSAANSHIVGTYVLSQFGGPLRAGPRTLYPLHGFWLWTDANVFVASRLAFDLHADVSQLLRQWARARFGDDPRVVDAVTSALTETRKAVLEGFYIRPFAEREVRVPGLELPPLMWIFEWDMVGGWHSLLSIVYQGTRGRVDEAIEEGHAAASSVKRARERLQAAFAGARPDACGQICDDALRSLEYQETLFEALGTWRQAFLSYYRWIETDDPTAWTMWREGRERFSIAANQHVVRFGEDPTFPAFDLTSATQAVRIANRGGWIRFLATGSVIAVIVLAASRSRFAQRWRALARLGGLARVGRVIWTIAVTPWRLNRQPVDWAAETAVAAVALSLVGLLAGSLTGFASMWMTAGSALLFGVVALAFESTAIRAPAHPVRGRRLVVAAGPLIPGITILLAVIAYFGPVGFWYSFWMSPVVRITFVTLVLAMPLWMAYVMFAAQSSDGWCGKVAGSFVAAGAGLLTLTVFLPGWVDVLRSLNRPLNFAPATDTMLFALRTYAGVNLDVAGPSRLVGVILLVIGYAMCLRSMTRAPRRTVSRS